jgi:CHAT domain-containing protein
MTVPGVGPIISSTVVAAIGNGGEVDDMATALLVAEFYDLHLGQRQPPAAALPA